MRNSLTAEMVRELLHYEATTGLFRWRQRRGSAKALAEAGYINENGYRTIQFFGMNHKAHRLAWLHWYGTWPANDIDHINGKRDDNRIVNLRDVPVGVNNQNTRTARGDNKSSGLLGASFHKSTGRWRANIRVSGVKVLVGCYATPEEAHQAYVKAKRSLHQGCTI